MVPMIVRARAPAPPSDATAGRAMAPRRLAILRPWQTKAKSESGPEAEARRKGRSVGGGTRRPPAGQPTQHQSRAVHALRSPKNVRPAHAGWGSLIVALFLLGVLVVILNYAELLPGGVNNLWLIAAIGAIFAGLLLATRYH